LAISLSYITPLLSTGRCWWRATVHRRWRLIGYFPILYNPPPLYRQVLVACDSAQELSLAGGVAGQYRQERAALVGRSQKVLSTYLEFLSC
jgi:hypothetical protein